MNTQTTKKSFKLNFIDILLIVLAVLVIGAAAAIFLMPKDTVSENTVPVEFTVLVKDLPEQMNIRSKKGDSVIDSIWLGNIGTVVSVKKEPATFDAFNYENEITVHSQYSDMYNAAFTIRANVTETDSYYYVGQVRVAVGAEVHFRTPNFVGYGYITDLKVLSAQPN